RTDAGPRFRCRLDRQRGMAQRRSQVGPGKGKWNLQKLLRRSGRRNAQPFWARGEQERAVGRCRAWLTQSGPAGEDLLAVQRSVVVKSYPRTKRRLKLDRSMPCNH